MADFVIENGILKKYTGEGGIVMIPSGVKRIEPQVFSGHISLTGIILPNSLVAIGKEAFSQCASLTEVVLPEGITTLSEGLFSGCRQLTRVVLPRSLKAIRSNVFLGCSSLKSIDIPDGVTIIDDRAFAECSGLTAITIPRNVRALSNELFCDCVRLRSVTLPESLAVIGKKAFCGCSTLSGIKLPDGLAVIGARAFSDCVSLSGITIPRAVRVLSEGLFSRCPVLTTVHLPEALTSIEAGVFEDCRSLADIAIPDGVRFIGEGAFRCCFALERCTLPTGLTAIANLTFHSCSQLEHISIPDSVTAIGATAFEDCSSLWDIRISKSAAMRLHAPWLRVAVLSDKELIGEIASLTDFVHKIAENRLLHSRSTEAAAFFEGSLRLEQYARVQGTDAEWLRNQVLCGIGLEKDGCVRFAFDRHCYTARLETDFTFTLIQDGRRVIRSFSAREPQPQLSAAKEKLSALKAAAKAAGALQIRVMQAEFIYAHSRSAALWRKCFVDEPLRKQLAKTLVWQQGAQTFLLNADCQPVDVTGACISLTDERILLAHPMEMPADELAAWQTYFTERQLKQPFLQLWEPVMDSGALSPNRYHKIRLSGADLVNKAEHGIRLHPTRPRHWLLELQDCDFYPSSEPIAHCCRSIEDSCFIINRFSFGRFTRAVNHIIVFLDTLTFRDRLKAGDNSAVMYIDRLKLTELNEILDFMLEEGKYPDLIALLIDHKKRHFPESDPFSAFSLD